MNTDKKDKILYSQNSFRKDMHVEVIHKVSIDTVEFKLKEGKNEICIPFNLTLFKGANNLNSALNTINRVNIIGRANKILKNFLKETLFKKLLDSGEIDENEYKMRMGKLLNNI